MENLDNRDINKCPATMLAVNRTDKVIGRIIFLVDSIRTMKFIREIGVDVGVKWIIISLNDFNHPHNMIDTHIVREITILTDKWAVGVKL